MLNWLHGRNPEAAASYLNALEMYKELGDTFMIGMMNNNIAGLYDTKEPDKSIEYFNKALLAFQELDTTLWIAKVKHNLGNQLILIEDFTTAIAHYQEAISLFRTVGDTSDVPSCLTGIGQCNWILNGPESALPYYLKAHELLDTDAQKMLVSSTTAALCGLYTELGSFNKAEPFCRNAERYAMEYGSLNERVKANGYIYKYYKATGDVASALRSLELLRAREDSLAEMRRHQAVMELTTKYETVQKEKQIQIQNLELARNVRERKFYFALVAILIILLVGAVVFTVQKIRTNRLLRSQKDLIDQSLKEKELLLREIHHRVKNNLQVISSLLSLQSREISDQAALDAVNESRNRVKSMALIHQNLYKEDDLTGIDMQDYIQKLAKSLLSSYKIDSNRIDLQTDIDNMSLDVDTTIPLGLILNELLTNTLKYAFPDGRDGVVGIELKEIDGVLKLSVSDNGVGMEGSRDAGKESTGFGLGMIKTFSKKLDADYVVKSNAGTTVELLIKRYKKAS
jgi:two-component sensor histidine kinase